MMQLWPVARKQILIAWFLASLAMGCSGCGGWHVPPGAKQLKNPVPANSATLDSARALYGSDCAKCHGINGDGKRPPGSAYSYNTQPTNFTRKRLMDAMSDGEIYWKITNGRKPMPSFKNRLSNEQRWELVNFLRTFAHSANSVVPSGSQPPR